MCVLFPCLCIHSYWLTAFLLFFDSFFCWNTRRRDDWSRVQTQLKDKYIHYYYNNFPHFFSNKLIICKPFYFVSFSSLPVSSLSLQLQVAHQHSSMPPIMRTVTSLHYVYIHILSPLLSDFLYSENLYKQYTGIINHIQYIQLYIHIICETLVWILVSLVPRPISNSSYHSMNFAWPSFLLFPVH